MKDSNRRMACRLSSPVTLVAAGLSLLLAVVLLAMSASAQEGGWLVVRADYGFRNQRTDVTRLFRDLITHGGVNGRIAVNNQTMGGDPVPGADKVLRVFATDGRGQQREFDYGEGGFVPADMFVVMRADDRSPRYGGGDRDDRNRPDDWGGNRGDRNGLTILRAFYGVQGKMVDVTGRVQGMVHNGTLAVASNNPSMGMDPVPGADKILIVFYQYHGQEQAAAASEGHWLSLP